MTVAFDPSILVSAIDPAAGPRHHRAGAPIERVLLGGKDAMRSIDELRAGPAVHAASERGFDRATKGDARGRSFRAALIWATADRVGMQPLLSESFQDHRGVGGVTFVNPFEAHSQALLSEILPPARPGR